MSLCLSFFLPSLLGILCSCSRQPALERSQHLSSPRRCLDQLCPGLYRHPFLLSALFFTLRPCTLTLNVERSKGLMQGCEPRPRQKGLGVPPETSHRSSLPQTVQTSPPSCLTEAKILKQSMEGFSLELCCAQSFQSCPTLCDPVDCSLPGSVRGILQVRILEWVAISFSRGTFPTQGLNPHLLCLLHWQADSLLA